MKNGRYFCIRLNICKDQNVTMNAWKNICLAFVDDFHNKSEKDKITKIKALLYKHTTYRQMELTSCMVVQIHSITVEEKDCVKIQSIFSFYSIRLSVSVCVEETNSMKEALSIKTQLLAIFSWDPKLSPNKMCKCTYWGP